MPRFGEEEKRGRLSIVGNGSRFGWETEKGFERGLWQRFSIAGSPGRVRRERGAGPDWEPHPEGRFDGPRFGGPREDVRNYST